MAIPEDAPHEQDRALLELFAALMAGARRRTEQLLRADPGLVTDAIHHGASRENSRAYFLEPIGNHAYAGVTALHVAAGAYQADLARVLIERGARPAARNRRGAEPLHYAAVGAPGTDHWDPTAQGDVIELLVEAGADPDALDKSGVAPLHKAVRTRCTGAVQTLLAQGADPRLATKSGSTPLHLAVQTTGRGGTGAAAAIEQQRAIIVALLAAGARPGDRDGKGTTVAQAATRAWIRDLLATPT